MLYVIWCDSLRHQKFGNNDFSSRFWTKPHFIAVDEPTNYLDVETVEALSKVRHRQVWVDGENPYGNLRVSIESQVSRKAMGWSGIIFHRHFQTYDFFIENFDVVLKHVETDSQHHGSSGFDVLIPKFHCFYLARQALNNFRGGFLAGSNGGWEYFCSTPTIFKLTAWTGKSHFFNGISHDKFYIFMGKSSKNWRFWIIILAIFRSDVRLPEGYGSEFEASKNCSYLVFNHLGIGPQYDGA